MLNNDIIPKRDVEKFQHPVLVYNNVGSVLYGAY